MATEFHEIVAMDLKDFLGKLILHVIDHATRFLAATFVASKQRKAIVSAPFKIWVSVLFGPPSKFFSNNGREFSNNDFSALSESWNIYSC